MSLILKISNLNLNKNSKLIIIFLRRNSWFCDLFVRVSNKVAYEMYTKCGYTVFRRVLDYYTGENDEDAFGKFKLVKFIVR